MLSYIRHRRYFIFLGFLLLALLALPIVARLSVDTVFRPQLSEQNASFYANLPRILSDLETLEEHPVFPASTYKNNAQFLLTKYIPMDGIENAGVQNPRYECLKRLSTNKVYNAWRTNSTQFQNLLADKEIFAIDTEWMKDLTQYDHWNYSYDKTIISNLSAIRNVNALTRLEIFSQLPVPQFQELRTLAFVNFIKLYRQGHGIEGLKIYRHVAFLLHTAGNLISSMTATSMLKDEYVLLSHFKIKGWEPVPIYYVETYAHVTWAWMGILKLSYFEDFPKAFLPYLKPQNGICAGALESVSNFTLYRDFFEPQSFFEANFTSNVQYTKNLFKQIQTDCNLSIYNKFLERSPASLHPFSSFTLDEEIFDRRKDTDYDFSFQDSWIYIPYVRRLVGMTYFSAGSPINYLMPYETKKKKFLGLNSAVY